MKKIILSIIVIGSLLIATRSVNSFQYELRNLILEGNFIDSANGFGSQRISIVVGIKDEPYGFVKTNTFDVRLNTAKSINENKATLQQAAQQFISENYPDIQ